MRSPVPGVGIFLFRYLRIVAVICCFTSATILAACGGNVNTTPVAGSTPGSGGVHPGGPSPSPTPAPGPLTASASTLSFPALGAANAQQLTISEANFSGTFNVNGCSSPSVATVSPLLGSGPSLVVTVTPVSGGACTLQIADGHGGVLNVPVTVTSAIHVSAPNGLTFTAVGPSSVQSLTASEAGFSGTFTITGCGSPTIVTVSPGSAPGPSFVTDVTPVSGGTCSLSITDGIGGTVSVPMTVTTAVGVAPSSFNFSGTGVAYAQSLTISETGFTGPFALSSCTGILGYAAAPGIGPSVTTQLMPLSSGNCNLVASDGIGGTTNIAVTVTTGNVSVSSQTRR
jgi:hypothetical protein